MEPDRRILRVLDANFNRSREGLRVCEEVFRFFFNDIAITRRLKKMRHRVTELMGEFSLPKGELLKARDVRADPGKQPSSLEKKRGDVADIFCANIERTKESLRAIEEFTKLTDTGLSDHFKKLRFQVYAIEKQAFPRLQTLRHHRSGRR